RTIKLHSSAIAVSSNLVICTSKDGYVRLFKNRYEKNPQTMQFGLGPIQNIAPSSPNRFLLSVTDSPVIVEIQIKTTA
ncbi:unnamed protein product, partial [Didymodactylos carnosus]